MRAWHMAGALVLALGGAPLAADNAKPRDEGATSSASSGAHHEAATFSSSTSSSGSNSSDTSTGSSPVLSGAQQRHPRPGTGHGTKGGSYNYAYASPYTAYDPGSLGAFGYYPYWYGATAGYSYSPYFYGAYRGGPSRTYGSSDLGSLRLLVDPPEARVYVDGYQAGTVDDFDGFLQRLRLSRGRHEIAFKLEGYRTYRIRVYVSGDQTLKIRHDLVRGTGEETSEEVLGSPADGGGDDRWASDGASIYVDGELHGTASQGSNVLQLTAGSHEVEVAARGRKTFRRRLDVREGQTVEITLR